MLKTHGIILGIAMMSLAACSSSQEADNDGVFSGEFRWTSSVGGIAGRVYTPDTLGYSVRLEFTNDGEVIAFHGDTEVGRSVVVSQEVAAEDSVARFRITYSPPLPVFPFATFEEQTVRVTGKLILEFADPCCDRYVHSFQKLYVR
jgi:hypothetical protein